MFKCDTPFENDGVELLSWF